MEQHHMEQHYDSPTRWTRDDVLAVQWVVMRFLAMGSPSVATIQRRLHWADHMLPCLESPGGMKGTGFDTIPDVGPLLALCSFVTNCAHNPDDTEWCRNVLREAQVDYLALLDTIAPLAHLYANPNDVPVQHFRTTPNDYALIPLADLPYGHSMHTCGHAERFEADLTAIRRRNKALRFVGRKHNPDAEQAEAGRRLTLAVINGAVDPCHQHQTGIDWTKVNSRAEHIRTTTTPWTKQAVEATVASAPGLTPNEQDLLRKLFVDPIRWDRGTTQVAGGQHRLCGYRVAGATHAFVAIH